MKLLLNSQIFLYCRFTVLISDCAESAPSAGQIDMLHGNSSFFYKNNEMRQIAPYSYVHFQNHVTGEMILTRQMKITTDYRERVMLCELSDVC